MQRGIRGAACALPEELAGCSPRPPAGARGRASERGARAGRQARARTLSRRTPTHILPAARQEAGRLPAVLGRQPEAANHLQPSDTGATRKPRGSAAGGAAGGARLRPGEPAGQRREHRLDGAVHRCSVHLQQERLARAGGSGYRVG